ncbi:hypothetical protein ACQ4LE_007767 [Meloidogyne hapla]
MSDSSESRDSGHPSLTEPDMRLSSLTVGQFWQQLDPAGNRQITQLVINGKRGPISIWSDGDPLNLDEGMEEFMRDAVVSFNQQQRAHGRPSSLPVIENRMVKLYVFVTDPIGPFRMTIEYTLRSGYHIRYR